MSKMFTVIEYASHFAVRHNPSSDEQSMGDGVDTLFDEEGNALQPDTPGFVEVWQETLNEDEISTLEAYFPSIWRTKSDCQSKDI